MSRATNHASTSEVDDDDVRVFKSTLLARRFPGLKDMSSKDIKILIMEDRKATGRKLEAPHKTYPKSDFTPPSPKRELATTSLTPIFTPINPYEAKRTIKRPDTECFAGIGTPYDADHTDFAADKQSDEAKRNRGIPFMPTCSSQAKTSIRVDYYLNSQDAMSKAKELSTTRERGRYHMSQYSELYESRRGKTLL
mmetsp:Transcript_3039/g.6601  ORF Transcript_3039/g.6601 Transcript_3039/m.6601 type:complete len:195 (+) Transcript_3039:69-653(+)